MRSDEAVIEFSRYNGDIIEAFECSTCSKREMIFRPLAKLKKKEACPAWGKERSPKPFIA